MIFSLLKHFRKSITTFGLILRITEAVNPKNMNYRLILYAMALAIISVSCKKDGNSGSPSLPEKPNHKVLLKDIIIPHLPSPYYHFEYGPDSLINKTNFASGYFIYDVFYNNNRISEMRNNILVNHDTLRYVYDINGRVVTVNFIDQNNVLKRHVVFTYDAGKVSRILWDHKANDGEFITDRTLSFTYHPDGNLKDMTDYRPAIPGAEEINFATHFDNYDDKVNVDDFTLIHDGIHDHFLILPGLQLQKNNARKEWVTGITDQYTVEYNFTYNADDTPVLKSGEFTFTSGSQAGQKLNVSTSYSYY
jgi:hypothetical protein